MPAHATSVSDLNPADFSLLTIARFCRLIGKSLRTFGRMRAAGACPPIIKIGSTPYIRVTDAETWIASIQPIDTPRIPQRRRRVRGRGAR
jgi:hypothetical protein